MARGWARRAAGWVAGKTLWGTKENPSLAKKGWRWLFWGPKGKPSIAGRAVRGGARTVGSSLLDVTKTAMTESASEIGGTLKSELNPLLQDAKERLKKRFVKPVLSREETVNVRNAAREDPEGTLQGIRSRMEFLGKGDRLSREEQTTVKRLQAMEEIAERVARNKAVAGMSTPAELLNRAAGQMEKRSRRLEISREDKTAVINHLRARMEERADINAIFEEVKNLFDYSRRMAGEGRTDERTVQGLKRGRYGMMLAAWIRNQLRG